jgi:hypothetical protein
MLWLLDRATQLTNLRRETPCPEPLTNALAATLLFAHAIPRSERFERYPADMQRARAS